jgi:hypothetical protein
MKQLTDSRSQLWSAVVELINLRQLSACIGSDFASWASKAQQVKRVSKSKRVHALADQLLAECKRVAQTQTWFGGMRLPRTQLVRELIHAHVVAVQSYDHDDADEIESYLFEIGHMESELRMAGA